MQFTTRPAAVAGLFYPADSKALTRQVERLLADAAVSAADALPPKLLVVPHAGYVYSGPVAAHAYARLARWRDRIRRVVLLGPTHRVAVRGLAVPTVAAFDTPIGRVDLDREAIAGLADLPQVVASDLVHADEHALEVQLPFLQSVLQRFALVPLAVGRVDADAVAQVLERLWGDDETVIVISTDLSHYLPYRQAQSTDRETVDRILQLDPQLDHQQACGATPLAGALLAARAHGLAPQLLDLRNSGDTAGDRSRVVGYCAIAFAAARDERKSEQTQHDAALGSALLSRARNAIADAFALGQRHEPLHPALTAPGATFVTLRIGGELRGCVGTLTALRPLADDVRTQALCAAFRDSRFEPLSREEFDALEIEVSLLEPALPIAARSEADACAQLRPGVDGVILEWRGARATFLPQVWEQLPEPREFLSALKRKAGLASVFWADDLRLLRYRVRKFVESERVA
ncbi:MAG TPA: AmmeMemoRadiSam system protein B [Burkholderiaceae bacterium]|nr:AmmeMemoRadiSam system protein B [Burkholderiaceae bacterium]